MLHAIHRITSVEPLPDYRLRLTFADGEEHVVELGDVVGRGMYTPLRDPDYFARVRLDEEAGTVVWPNGADFDPAILHDWSERREAFVSLVETWSKLGDLGSSDPDASAGRRRRPGD